MTQLSSQGTQHILLFPIVHGHDGKSLVFRQDSLLFWASTLYWLLTKTWEVSTFADDTELGIVRASHPIGGKAVTEAK